MKRSFIYFSRIFVFPFLRACIEEIDGKENLPKEGNFIIASNHQSHLDSWLIMFVLNERLKKIHFLGTKEGISGFIKHTILYYFSETVAVDRKHVKREKILRKLEDVLKKDRIVIIYPEGNSNIKSELLKGKTGVAELALKTGKPVIPIGIHRKEKSSKYIIRIGKPTYFLKEKELFERTVKDSEDYRFILREVTDKIMVEISKLCKKPYNFNYENNCSTYPQN
jgi:1-acyl-sn-glycerol-3-phosphate acyltransferase